ncbi:phage tail protein [Corynebacterium sp. H127]|uniref:phage tail protein n=1 Tax=Corynebacterium sp. H127 TaxID=3133418 RepID=UPI00309A0AC5
MDLELIGCDGSRWNIHGYAQGAQGVEVMTDVKGLLEAPVKAIWTQGAFQEGSTYMGFRTEPFDVVLPVEVEGNTTYNFQLQDSRFRRALGTPDDEFQLRARSSDGLRTLTLRMTEIPEYLGAHDPTTIKKAEYVLQARGAWPRWVGDTDTDTFTAPTGEGSGFVTVSNPTDTPLYPHWICSAPGKWTLPDFSWSNDRWASRVISTPTLLAGQGLSIDTYPFNEPYVAADGSNIAGRFAGVMFLHPVPPHTPPTEIPVSVTGGGPDAACQVRMVRNWRRPYGGDQEWLRT